MSSTPINPESEDTTDPVVTETPAPAATPASDHPDPITGEPGAHPVGVGVGALGAGAAGAAIGAIGGPIGMLIGAAIGAVAGGLAGKEVATSSQAHAKEEPDFATDEPTATTPADLPTPVSMGSVPGEGFRAMGGAGFASDAGLLSTGTSNVTEMSSGAGAAPMEMMQEAGASRVAAMPMEDVENDALPTPTHFAAANESGFQAPVVPGTAPLAGTTASQGGQEAMQVSAYYHYLGRTASGESGDALGDWLAAEREMALS